MNRRWNDRLKRLERRHRRRSVKLRSFNRSESVLSGIQTQSSRVRSKARTKVTCKIFADTLGLSIEGQRKDLIEGIEAHFNTFLALRKDHHYTSLFNPSCRRALPDDIDQVPQPSAPEPIDTDPGTSSLCTCSSYSEFHWHRPFQSNYNTTSPFYTSTT